MKNYRFYSILGLAATGIILIDYLVYFILSKNNLLTNGELLLISLFSMFSGLFTFLSLRYIIVIKSKLIDFRIVIPLIIISQLLASGLTLLIRYQIFSLIYVTIPLFAIGLGLTGSYLWFFIILSKTDKREIQGLSFLQNFGLTLLVLLLLKAIFSIIPIQDIKISRSAFELFEAFPYVFIFLFFKQHIKLSKIDYEQNT
jgi:hypothetical protein